MFTDFTYDYNLHEDSCKKIFIDTLTIYFRINPKYIDDSEIFGSMYFQFGNINDTSEIMIISTLVNNYTQPRLTLLPLKKFNKIICENNLNYIYKIDLKELFLTEINYAIFNSQYTGKYILDNKNKEFNNPPIYFGTLDISIFEKFIENKKKYWKCISR
jgi:hypothetical protein